MNYIRDKKIFYINSRNRQHGTDNDFEVVVDLPVHQKYNKICILSAIIPKSYYNVQAEWNTFILKEDDKQVTISIPPANYNRRSLAKQLAYEMSNASPNGLSYNVTFPNSLIDGDDGKYLYTVDNPNFDCYIIVDDNGMYELLGFNPNTINRFVDGKLKSTNVCKIQSEDVIRIHSSISSNDGDDVLLEIYASSTQTFSNIVWSCPDVFAYSRDISRRTTNVYRFYLTNEDNQPLDLNGLNVCFTIMVYETTSLFSR